MKLTPAQREQVKRLHQDALARVVAAEAIATELTRRVVMGASSELMNRAALTLDPRSLRRDVAELGPRLAVSFAGAVRDSRRTARTLALGQVSSELDGIRVALESTEWSPSTVPVVQAAQNTTDLDNAAAIQGGHSISTRWMAVSLASIAMSKRKNEPPRELARRFASTPIVVDGSVRRIAVTSSVDAYADEHRGAWKAIRGAGPYRTPGPVPTEDRDTRIPVRAKTLPGIPGGPGDSGEPGLPYGWDAGLFDVWSATLDRKTCPLCMDKDGSMVPKGKEWPGFGRPPVHPFCRCTPVTLFVPEVAAKRLPGIQIDYAALKEDVREFFSSSQFTGRKHAERYIREVIERQGGRFVTTSPEALTRRFRDRKGYYLGSGPPKARAPMLPPILP